MLMVTLLLLLLAVVGADVAKPQPSASASISPDGTSASISPNGTTTTEGEETVAPVKLPDLISELEWGGNYDPLDKFCGKYDCYAILGFSYDSDRYTLSKKAMKKSYRDMSKKYHPDKLPRERRGGEDEKLFAFIAKANEVLNDAERKQSYDYYFKHPNEYHSAFGSSFMGFTYAPEASVVSVFLIIGAFLTILGWFTRRSFYNKIKEHVVQAAVNEWSSMRGGGAESVHVRALCEFYYMRLKSDAGTAPVKEKKGKKGGKLSPVNSAADLGQEITEDPALQAKLKVVFDKFKPSSPHLGPREYDKEVSKHCFKKFCEIIVENTYSDFGGGFRKPKAPDDLLPYMIVKFLVTTLPKNARWQYRRMVRSPFDEGEVMWLTKDAMGVRWDLLGEEERKEAFGRELWNEGELEKWDFEQTVKLYGDKKARKLREFKEKGGVIEEQGGGDF